MTLCKNCCRNIRLVGPVMLGLLAVLLLHAPLATAQEPLEQQYQRALDLFNKGKMEDACELFQQIEKEKPGYKETPAHRKAACAEATRLFLRSGKTL